MYCHSTPCLSCVKTIRLPFHISCLYYTVKSLVDHHTYTTYYTLFTSCTSDRKKIHNLQRELNINEKSLNNIIRNHIFYCIKIVLFLCTFYFVRRITVKSACVLTYFIHLAGYNSHDNKMPSLCLPDLCLGLNRF